PHPPYPHSFPTRRSSDLQGRRMSVSLLSLRNIRLSLGEREILRGIDAEVHRGKITALIGLNGSGKTTLLRCILRELPCEGTIQLDRKSTRLNSSHQIISY